MTAVRPDAGTGVTVFPDRASLDKAAADLITELSQRAVTSRGKFTIALSGGTTPRGLYSLLASSSYRERIDWRATHVFWADERAVAPDHEDSNFRLAQELLLSQVPIARKNVHRIRGEDGPAFAASSYEQELLSLFDKDPFLFDLVILGMGADGHTASLFPGSRALPAASALVLPVAAGGTAHERITLTLAAINRCRQVLFLVAGAEKAGTVREVLEGKDRERYPAALVRPVAGQTLWFLDSAAGSMLGSSL